MSPAKTRPRRFRAAAIIAFGCIVAPVHLFSQQAQVNILPRRPNQGRTGGPAVNLRVDTTMVLIPVTVTDGLDHPVTDLPGSSFRLFEGGVEQAVQSFFRQDGPVSVGFIVDASRSMEKRIGHSLAAIEHILGTQVDGDEWFVIGFGTSPRILTRFTRNPTKIRESLSSIQCDGWTALNDAIYLGIHEMKGARNARKALLVLTDASDNFSRYSDSELRTAVRESDVRIYSIGWFERPMFLDRLARESGGNAFFARKLTDVSDAVDKLNNVFRSEYVLGYVPKSRLNDGKYRQVRVKLAETTGRERLRVSWRRGYYSGW